MDKRVFKFVYGCALHDAVNQRAYPHDNKGHSPAKNEIEANYPRAMDIVRAFADQVLDKTFASQCEYDNAFWECTEQLHREMPFFTFGNIQKLINMTLKYLYIKTYHDKSLRVGFRFCHCPVDGKMLAHIWKVRNQLNNRPPEPYSWSREDFGDTEKYRAFQDAAREHLQSNPAFGDNLIELDYNIW